uniref:DNA oxidative demethylase ALKBH2 n=1 Tax=Oryzias latipes TaxID=8090 RepID=A0A3P9MCG8_ORYLA
MFFVNDSLIVMTDFPLYNIFLCLVKEIKSYLPENHQCFSAMMENGVLQRRHKRLCTKNSPERREWKMMKLLNDDEGIQEEDDDTKEADELFKHLEEEVVYSTGEEAKVQVYGKVYNIPRKQATYGDTGLMYTYSGVTRLACPWTPTLENIRDAVTKATGQTFNFVLINRYKDGLDHMGEHRDDEKELDPSCPIASVSLGAARDFVFRHRDARGRNSSRQIEPVKLELSHGSLLLMNPPTNHFWYHSLPVRRKTLQPRINLTFRRILNSKK